MVRMLDNVGSRNYAGEDNFLVHLPEVEDVDGEVALWRAVITQALMDAGSRSAKPEVRLYRAQAVAWLSGESGDFAEVCARADLDPSYVQDKAREAIRRGCTWRKDACRVIRETKRRKLKALMAVKEAEPQQPAIVTQIIRRG